jgi:hypothetical protein
MSKREAILGAGREAIARLFAITEGSGEESRMVAAFLLSAYDGSRFPMAVSQLTSLSPDLLEDCLAVLRADGQEGLGVAWLASCCRERFEELALAWRIRPQMPPPA